MIRRVTEKEIPLLYSLAESFCASSAFIDPFDRDYFTQVWTALITKEIGVIFLLEEQERVVGMLGGIKYPDLQNGTMTATECFWYVLPEKRGRGMSLLSAFEKWADSQGCKKKIMVHLMDSMPEKLKRVYEHKGYRAVEVHYVKEN